MLASRLEASGPERGAGISGTMAYRRALDAGAPDNVSIVTVEFDHE